MPCSYEPRSEPYTENELRSISREHARSAMYHEACVQLIGSFFYRRLDELGRIFPNKLMSLIGDPIYPYKYDINKKLCDICKSLTPEQMKNINAIFDGAEWEHKTLYDWHLQHVKDDEVLNGEPS